METYPSGAKGSRVSESGRLGAGEGWSSFISCVTLAKFTSWSTRVLFKMGLIRGGILQGWPRSHRAEGPVFWPHLTFLLLSLCEVLPSEQMLQGFLSLGVRGQENWELSGLVSPWKACYLHSWGPWGWIFHSTPSSKTGGLEYKWPATCFVSSSITSPCWWLCFLLSDFKTIKWKMISLVSAKKQRVDTFSIIKPTWWWG